MFYKENKIKEVINKEFSNKEIYFNSIKVLIINEKKFFASAHFPIFARFNKF